MTSSAARALYAGALALVLAGLGARADRVFEEVEPALPDLLREPARYAGRAVAFNTHDSARRGGAAIDLIDREHRLRVVGPVGAVADGDVVSVAGTFDVGSEGPRVLAERVVRHPLRPWKQAVSGAAALVLLMLLLRTYRATAAGIARRSPCRTS